MRLTFWVLYDATDVVPGAVGGDGGQSDLVGQRDPQVCYGVGQQHPLLWLLALEVNLLRQYVLLVLDLYRWTHTQAGQDADMLKCMLTDMHKLAKNSAKTNKHGTQKKMTIRKCSCETETVRVGVVNNVRHTVSSFLLSSYHPQPHLYHFMLIYSVIKTHP